MTPSHSEIIWSTHPAETVPPNATKVWDHLARWHTWREVLDNDRSEATTQKAARYQLVTPVSGAVVQETQAQYREFGLKQADPDSVPSVPSVPEPSSALLTLLGFSLLVFRRQR